MSLPIKCSLMYISLILLIGIVCELIPIKYQFRFFRVIVLSFKFKITHQGDKICSILKLKNKDKNEELNLYFINIILTNDIFHRQDQLSMKMEVKLKHI